MATPKRTPKPKGEPFRLKHSTELIARVLIDAEFLGDKRAAEEHDIHHRTVENWRAAYRYDAEVIAEVNRLRRIISENWIDRAKQTRGELVNRVRELARTSRNLTAVTNGLRRVHEVVLSHEIVNDGAEPQLPDQPADPGEAEGEG